MNSRFLFTLVLAGLVAGIFLLRFEVSPSTESAKTGSAEERLQFKPADSQRPFGPVERDATGRMSLRGADSAAEPEGSPVPVEDSAAKPLERAGVNRAVSAAPDHEGPEKSVIGGLVQDEDGNPVSYVEVLAERLDDFNGTPGVVDLELENAQSVFSDFSGAFLFENLEDGEYQVRLAPVEGIAPAQSRVRAGALNVNLVLVELRDVGIYGTVSSTDGVPIKNVQIVADPTIRSTRSGSKGEYELDINWQGKNVVYTVLFQHEGFRQHRLRIDPDDLDDLTGDFQLNVSMEPLNRLTTVAGRLTDTNGIPLGGQRLDIVTYQLRTWYRSESDAHGNFLFEGVEPGKDHQLRIRPDSRYKNKDINPLVVPEGGLNLDIVLEMIDEGELSGRMIDLDGHPVPGFSLTLRSTIAATHSVNVVSDQQGFFSVEDFPAGGALFRTNSDPVLMVQGIRVSPEPAESVTVVLDTGRHVLQGWVLDRFDAPVAASSITLDWAVRENGLRNSSTRKTLTDQNGNFVFTGLGPGLHSMQVSAAGYNTAALNIDVGIDPMEIVIELEEENQ